MTEAILTVSVTPTLHERVFLDSDGDPAWGSSVPQALVGSEQEIGLTTDGTPYVASIVTQDRQQIELDSDNKPFLTEDVEVERPEPIGLTNTPFYIRQRQDWARDQEIYRHDQALWQTGELVMFALMWHVEDFQHGLVQRCSTCYSGNTLDSRAAAVFNQPTKFKCPDCFGTTFEGGYRAKIIRPALFTDADDQEVVSKRGTTNPQRLTVESTSDFRFRNGDYVFRQDNSRWQLGTPRRSTLRTGFGHPDQADTSIGYAQTDAVLEYEGSPAYDIPPTDGTTLASTLAAPTRYPGVLPDVLNGPLIPPAWTD